MNAIEIIATILMLIVILLLIWGATAPTTFDPNDHPPKDDGPS